MRSTHRAMVVPAGLMIVFGIAETYTAFSHNFFGLTTVETGASTISSAALGCVYALAGAILLTLRRGAAWLAILLLGADVLGRIALVVTGIYPTDTLKQQVGIVAGTAIAVVFAGYIWWQRRLFR